MTVFFDGSKVEVVHPVPSSAARDYVKQTLIQKGAQIQSSQWVGWVPQGNCPGGGNVHTSTFSITNITVSGTVVQGHTPRLCNNGPAPTPTPSPRPRPAPTPL